MHNITKLDLGSFIANQLQLKAISITATLLFSSLSTVLIYGADPIILKSILLGAAISLPLSLLFVVVFASITVYLYNNGLLIPLKGEVA